MRLTDRFDGGGGPFEGDRATRLVSLPSRALVRRATATVTPIDATRGASPFAETVRFTGASGDWGATKTVVAGRWVEVSFHGRRTLVAIRGNALAGTTLQVDLGGAYVDVGASGGIRTPDQPAPFALGNATVEPLPALTVAGFKLTNPALVTATPDVDEVTVRSVPTNVSLRLGALGPFWTHVGEMTRPETTPDFAEILKAFLATAEVENGFAVVPLVLHSDAIGRVEVALDVEYDVEETALPAGLTESTLTYDFSSIPTSRQTIDIDVPAGARIAARGISARVRGAFEDTRVAFDSSGVGVTDPPATTVALSPAVSYAQPIRLAAQTTATAVDLFVVVTKTARLQLDLRDDVDGKPGTTSVLPRPAAAEQTAPVGIEQDPREIGKPQWVSVRLPAEARFVEGRRYWLVVQSVDGEVALGVDPAPAGATSLHGTNDGGLSWRAVAGSAPLAARFRLRNRPDRFRMPVALVVGEGEHAVRVGLERFEPLGRVDFSLDFDEVSAAANSYLAATAPAACPETEHLADGDFERWLRNGDELAAPDSVEVPVAPRALGVSPDGASLYGAGPGRTEGEGLVQVVDAACDRQTAEVVLRGMEPSMLAVGADGSRVYASDGSRLQVIDAHEARTIGAPLGLDGAFALAIAPDGSRLYVVEDRHGGTLRIDATVRALDTAALERLALRGASDLAEAVVAAGDLNLAGALTAIAVSHDGASLFATVEDANGVGAFHAIDTSTLRSLGAGTPVGRRPVAIALTPDGRRAVVANSGDSTVSVVEAEEAGTTIAVVPVGGGPSAVAVAPDGVRAFVAHGGDAIVVVDLVRFEIAATVAVSSAASALAITPDGDTLFAAIPNASELLSIQIGSRVPAEWGFAGQVAPVCVPDPHHRVVALGTRRQSAAPAGPSALSQVVPVAAGCVYVLAFDAVATGLDAVAEVFWLGDACGALLRTDRVRIQPLDTTKPAIGGVASARDSLLVPHVGRWTAPDRATQAEVRFGVPEGVVALVDGASFRATAEAVANGDLSLMRGGELGGWTLAPASAPGVTLLDTGHGVRVQNAGTGAVELVQTVAAEGGRAFDLRIAGRTATARPQTETPARVELRWLDGSGAATGAPTVVEIRPGDSDVRAASGRAPEGAVRAELHVAVPPGVSQEIDRVSLRFSSTVRVPLTLTAEAPGELTISDVRVAFEDAPPRAPAPPATGLCPSTPPGQSPGETCDECETKMQTASAVVRRPAAPRPVLRPVKLRWTAVARPAPIPLEAVNGIGDVRARQLRAFGVLTVRELAVAEPALVARLPGVSDRMAARFVDQARELSGR